MSTGATRTQTQKRWRLTDGLIYLDERDTMRARAHAMGACAPAKDAPAPAIGERAHAMGALHRVVASRARAML
eukprot:6174533-Pleurochrysis_carterae.AAC.1